MAELRGKRAIITGSNSGVGLGVARELAKAGANVVLNSFTNPPDQKKRPHEAGVKLLRQVSYRQETYRAVPSLYANCLLLPS